MKTLEFFNTITGVADTFPIIKAVEYRPNWVKTAKDAYNIKKEKMDGSKFFHVYRCPGIFDLMSTGYIVPAPWDVEVETMGDGEDFRWRVPDTPEITALLEDSPVVGHMANAIADSLPQRPGRLNSVIKLTTGWNMIAPPGVKFMVIPIPYPDSYEFESAPGILDPGLSTELNAQLYWYVPKGRHVIKAGTPLFQVVPMTDEKFKMVVRNATENDKAWVKRRRYFIGISFKPNRNLLREVYNRIWGKK